MPIAANLTAPPPRRALRRLAPGLALGLAVLVPAAACGDDDTKSGADACQEFRTIGRALASEDLVIADLPDRLDALVEDAQGTDLLGPAEDLQEAATVFTESLSDDDDAALATELQSFAERCDEIR